MSEPRTPYRTPAAQRAAADKARLVGLLHGIEEAVATGNIPEAEVLLTLLPDHVLGAPHRYFSSSCLLGIGSSIAALSREVPR